MIVNATKFESGQRVRIRVGAKVDDTMPGPRPPEDVMGMIAVVEVGGIAYGSGVGNKKSLSPAYFVRVKDIGQILVGEGWLDDAPLSNR